MSTKMRTTTLTVETPIKYDCLSQAFKLIRYAVPEKFNNLPREKRDDAFRRVHIAAKELNQPYYFFSNDKPEPGIYVLYGQKDEVQSLKLDFLSNHALVIKVVAFEELQLHLILKLLLARYFKSNRRTEFVHQGRYYIQANAGKNTVTCLQIEFKGDKANKQGTSTQNFKVIGHATRFVKRSKEKIEEWHKYKYDYFERMPKGGQVLFRQLAPTEIDGFDGDIYAQYTTPDQRATLDYHSQLRPERTRGKVLYDFINNFINHLARYNILATQKVRQFTEYEPRDNNADLPLEELGPIKLVDIRRNTQIPVEDYQILLQTAYPHLSFVVAGELKPEGEQSPLLLLQDGNKEDFLAEGLLGGPDPRDGVYRAHPDAPKQTINVNPNESQKFKEQPTAYLDYPLIALKKDTSQKKEKRFDLRFAVCLNQLFLKDPIFNGRNVIGRLPCLNTVDASLLQYAFIRKKTYEGKPQHVMIYFKDNVLEFINLGDPAGKQLLYRRADEYGVDWNEAIDKFKQKYYKKNEEDIKRYDFIIGPGQIIEIEDIEERVLYEYDEIIRRKQELDKPYPIERLKLVDRYDDLKGSAKLLLEKLLLLDKFVTKKAQQSQAFLAQLKAYDDFLDELGANRLEISFNELTSEANMPRIGQIFDIKLDKKGKYNRGKFKGLYQTLGMFLSDKGGDVQQYSGIWYDDENCFMVGSPEGLKDKQPRAHLIRKFDIYVGSDLFNIQTLMPTMEVKFVRHEQYTVYPYFFHLIDLYVETKLNFD